MLTYYNEFDKKKCAMLKALMDDGHISKGVIDNRPIQEVTPNDLQGFTRCHFFAGIGLWDYALQLAGWPDDEPVWTGSCPCQPFSSAGRQKGKGDDRHLWPEWLRLIRECRPATFFGEQVASAITHGWLDDVYQGLESEGYAIGAVVLPACSVGAPHRRERLWFVGHAEHDGFPTESIKGSDGQAIFNDPKRTDSPSESTRTSEPRNVAYPEHPGLEGHPGHEQTGHQSRREQSQAIGSAWASGVWIDCPDGKQRLIEPSIPLLADGDSARVAIIHAAGDAIVPQVAAEFIKAYMETKSC